MSFDVVIASVILVLTTSLSLISASLNSANELLTVLLLLLLVVVVVRAVLSVEERKSIILQLYSCQREREREREMSDCYHSVTANII